MTQHFNNDGGNVWFLLLSSGEACEMEVSKFYLEKNVTNLLLPLDFTSVENPPKPAMWKIDILYICG